MSLPIHVATYSGFKATHRPREFVLDDEIYEIATVLDQLSAAQIHYAATDAWIRRELFLRFRGLGMIPDARIPAQPPSQDIMEFPERVRE